MNLFTLMTTARNALRAPNPRLEHLKQVAADIGSNVVVRTGVDTRSTYAVDALVFDDLEAAIDHCEQVA